MRSDIEHILRAAKEVTRETEFVLVGSQAVLVQYSDAPAEMLRSNDVDIYPEKNPHKSEMIDGAIGSGSQFDQTYGFHADGVDDTTAILPSGWRDRACELKTQNTKGAKGIAPEIHDLAASKLFAGRPKDIEWGKIAVKHGLVEKELLICRIKEIETNSKIRVDHAVKLAEQL
ncbi:MAG: DUF6036 family nucleotidyltransferase [Woeseia sp.]